MLLWSWIFCWECNSTKILNGMNLFVTFDRKLKTLTKFEFLGLFFIRIYLAYIFWIHGNSKLTDVEKFSSWLGSIDIPFPGMVAWMLISSELIGALLLLVGLFVRWVTLPLLTPMILAISFVNWDNGWSYENGGVELLVTYSILLLVLLFSGAGKYLSLDYWVSSRR